MLRVLCRLRRNDKHVARRAVGIAFAVLIAGHFAPISVAAPAGCPGDYNADGSCNTVDYTLWRNNVGTTTVLPNDPIGGTIGAAQYVQWKAHFGDGLGSGLVAGVVAIGAPEPASWMLAASAMLLFGIRRARR